MTEACFKISGEFITEHTRTLVLEDRWEDALHLLMDCVVGTDYQIAISVLSGEQRFTGINNLALENEDPAIREQLQKALAYHFCGVVKHGIDYWRPYAYVDGWFEGDLNRHTMTVNRYHHYDGPAPTKLSDQFRTWSRARNNFYMTNVQEDLATLAEVNHESVIVLWSKVRVPPPWITIQRDRQPAVNEFLQHRWLEHRGAHQFTERTERKEVNLSEADVHAREQFEQEQEAKYQADYAAIVEKITIHNLDTRNGWLSPTGQLIPCLYMEHDFFALVILSEKYKVDNQQVLTTRGDALSQRGWVKLQNREWVHDLDLVTQDQYDMIWDYSQKHGLKMPHDIEVK